MAGAHIICTHIPVATESCVRVRSARSRISDCRQEQRRRTSVLHGETARSTLLECLVGQGVCANLTHWSHSQVRTGLVEVQRGEPHLGERVLWHGVANKSIESGWMSGLSAYCTNWHIHRRCSRMRLSARHKCTIWSLPNSLSPKRCRSRPPTTWPDIIWRTCIITGELTIGSL